MLEPFTLSCVPEAADIWNAATTPSLAISRRLVEYNVRPSTGAVREGRMAVDAGVPIGFVIATALPNDSATSNPEVGWVEILAVRPEAQGRGAGSALLAWAESWLCDQGCVRARLGGGLRPFAPGLAVELNNEPFFSRRGYRLRQGSGYEWDMATDLAAYVGLPSATRTESAILQAAEAGDQGAILAFLQREFPNRWRYEFEEFLRDGGRMSDYVLLWSGRGVDGFARLTLMDSERPIERFYMNDLPRPWGQLGPIGVSRDTRGQGYGGALLDAGLCRLRDLGARGCVIDWTDLVGFYGKFGFRPYRKYAMLVKDLKS